MFAHLIPQFVAGVLATLIGMKQHLFWPASQVDRHPQRFAGQRGIGNHRKRPAHDPTGKQIQHRREIHPARADFDVGHIAAPHLVDRRDIKLALEHMRHHQRFHAGRFVLVPPPNADVYKPARKGRGHVAKTPLSDERASVSYP